MTRLARIMERPVAEGLIALLVSLFAIFLFGSHLVNATPVDPDHPTVLPDFFVKRPFNGQPASPGNGSMVAFQAENQSQVRELHGKALAAGGTDEGSPGFRASYGPRFYVAYLRDPQGNKVALYSSNPQDPSRDD